MAKNTAAVVHAMFSWVCQKLLHDMVLARILAKITAEGVFVEELEHNPASWMIFFCGCGWGTLGVVWVHGCHVRHGTCLTGL